MRCFTRLTFTLLARECQLRTLPGRAFAGQKYDVECLEAACVALSVEVLAAASEVSTAVDAASAVEATASPTLVTNPKTYFSYFHPGGERLNVHA